MDVNSLEVNVTTLINWQDALQIQTSTRPSASAIDLPENLLRNGHYDKSPFPLDEKINQKIAFWVGNVWLLNADAIVCCNNENFTSKTDLITKHTLIRAGKDLIVELRQTVRYCRTGEAKLTSGYLLPASHIIHTVSPKYSHKYTTAAETSLHNAYKNVLVLARDNNIRTLGLRCIHSSVCRYPPFLGANVALRTIRRFLEKWGDKFDKIVLAVSNHNKEAYSALLPLYFPRNNQEELAAKYQLPQNVGDVDGQLFLEERQIRISANPICTNLVRNINEAELYSDEEDRSSQDRSSGGFIRQQFRGINESFMKAKENVDKERLKRLQTGGNQMILNKQPIRKEFYKRLLIRAKKEDFTDFIRRRFIYQSGVDREGRAVVVFLVQRWRALIEDQLMGRHHTRRRHSFVYQSMPNLNDNPNLSIASLTSSLPPEISELHRLFFISQLDPIVDRPYVFIYVHSLSNKDDLLPSNKCMQALLGMLHPKYVTNLNAFYILHSTLINKIKSFFKFPSELYDRTTFVKGVEHLYSLVSPDQLELPGFVLAHDLDLYGVRYYEPDSRNFLRI
ncbi:hypothetical protein HELRODRAFT_185472 [Helobdella robusta]|uniref:Macro domain-containing protein n=1 Tax=Helobdella robusta TaxID=6412 RepID=T1FMV0_HELRO|nr:hypothetical protein HELRODRAFT_185472 [Helobdella robusta]ESO07399.1 hypothetical protein HELRODRAFT_185472 [Helobdella robusta]